jgi:hypothetical protein
MGNLGLYQGMTWLAKRVGGPLALALITAVVGYLTGRAGEAGIKRAYKKLKNKLASKIKSYDVTLYGKENNGLEFNVGDKFMVLESDGDAVLIELVGDTDNPHFVSGNFLQTISNFTK